MDATPPQKVVACHQPVYLPFVGFFQKMARADAFVFMPFVQLNKRSWQVRNQIKGPHGPVWLSLPVHVKGKYHQTIGETKIVEGKWRHKHWEAIRHNYARAPYFEDYAPFFEETYARPWEGLAELNLHLIAKLREFLEVTTPIVDVDAQAVAGTKSDLIIDICRQVDATAYLSSDGEVVYIEKEKFAAAGLGHSYLGWEPTPYPQLFGEFVPNLAAIDLLFNCGPASRDVVRGKPYQAP
ncbi:MAG: WbqC family protein [Candidatus Coatesbacteria bacterium]|nr:MAG: WbqC family protein [Candidatus Coatesbacteria bacterium]